MPTLTVRKLDDATYENLKKRADANGRSMESEARQILDESTRSRSGVADWIRLRSDAQTESLPIPPRGGTPLAQRIAVDAEIVHGKPRIRGTRVTVQVILELLAAGDSVADILADYSELTELDIRAAIRYAALNSADAVSIPFDSPVVYV